MDEKVGVHWTRHLVFKYRLTRVVSPQSQLEFLLYVTTLVEKIRIGKVSDPSKDAIVPFVVFPENLEYIENKDQSFPFR